MKNLLAIVNDASRFVRYFGMTMARSTPHIYVSALPFTPRSSHIFNLYIRKFPCTLSLERGQLSHWPALEMMIQAHDKTACSVAFSPDGQRIASASFDKTIRVWDATTGQIVAGPFTGHTDPVWSVAFSPDGLRIASASFDKTIRVWDASTGQIVAGPFTGHTSSVYSVAFSPDGLRIASASYDKTIRVWDATTGQIVAGPFTGHTEWVNSVAFSPDGLRIASASSDKTIRVWDATTCQIITSQFTGHTNPVRSACEQDTASGSGDCVIHVESIVIEDFETIQFTDRSLVDGDGWICGEQKELLLWIPALHRPCLHRPSTVWISGEHETRLDFSKFVHGSNWGRLYDRNI